MKALVLLKKTPDTEAKLKLSGDGKSIDFSDTKFIINPYDEYAIEEALQIKQKVGDCEVVICSFGDDATRELIVKGLAMGGDRGLLINNAGLENADSLTIAKILAAAIESEKPDLVFAGRHAIDDDNMHVPTMLAEFLGWPHVNVVTKLEVNGNKAVAERAVEGGQVEVYEIGLPAVIGADKALNQPRYASLPGIMKAKRKPLDVKSPSDFGVSVGGASKVQVTEFKFPPEKPPGQIFKGEAVDVMVEKVVKALREEAKVL